MTKNNFWFDEPGYPILLDNNSSHYVQYPQTNFEKSSQIILNAKNGTYTTPIKQTQFPEFEEISEELQKFGFELANYYVANLGNRCSKDGYFQKCECGKINYKPHYCHDIHTCPICNRARAKTNGRNSFHTIMQLNPDYVGHLVLTTPPEHPICATRQSYREETENALRSLAAEFMATHFTGYGYMCAVHSWNSKKPLQGPHWHIHIIIPLVKIGENNQIIHRNGYRSRLEFKQMRDTWRNLLGMKNNVNLNYGFTKTSIEKYTHKIRHWCNYIARGATVDINKYLLDKPETEMDKERIGWFRFHTSKIRYHYSRIRSYGLMAACKRGGFLKACNSSLTVVHGNISLEIEESKKLYCWSCGAELDPRHWEWNIGHILRSNFARSNDNWDQYRDLVS